MPTLPPPPRYDDLKTAQENIDLQSTILSRFDLIFIVKVGVWVAYRLPP